MATMGLVVGVFAGIPIGMALMLFMIVLAQKENETETEDYS